MTAGGIGVALAVVAGLVLVRYPGLIDRSPPMPGIEGSARATVPGPVFLHLFPTPTPQSPDRTYRSYAALRRERLAETSSPSAPTPAPAPVEAAAPRAAPPSATATAAPVPLPEPAPAAVISPAAAPSPEQSPAAVATTLPEMPRLKLTERPVPLAAIVLVSGVTTTAPAMPSAAPEVRVAEIEAPVALPPKAASGKPAPPRHSDAGAKRARAVEAEPLTSTPLIPPADLAGAPPPVREPLSLDTSLAPLTPSGFEAPAVPGASGTSTNGTPRAPSAAPSAPLGAGASSKESSLLAAHAATLPPAQPRKEAVTERIVFEVNATDLPSGADRELDAIVAAAAADPHRRVQLISYASGDADGGNQARRVSLSRALAVRAYLIQQGIASGRLEVRALGNRNESGPGDRVDLRVGDP